MQINLTNLEGVRVKLIPLEEIHAEGLFEAGREPAIWTYMPRHVNTLEDMVKLVGEALVAKEGGMEYPFVIWDKQTGKIVGSTRFLNISVPNRNLEIGWTWYSPEVWRTPVNTECKYLLLHHCFEALSTIRVQFKADRRNERSNRAIARLGAIQEGILRQDRIMPDGYIRDSVYHSILAEEWPEVKVRLEGFLLSGN
jgi:RimJ/RimL family protein N-acetyltransferase